MCLVYEGCQIGGCTLLYCSAASAAFHATAACSPSPAASVAPRNGGVRRISAPMPISISVIRSSAPPPMPISAPRLSDHYPHRSASLVWISARAPVAGGGTCSIRARPLPRRPACSTAHENRRGRELRRARARAPPGASTAVGTGSRPLAGAPSRLQRRKKKELTSRTDPSVREGES